MPPPLPPRFRLEVRLGRDDDTEEWLATDTDLDRPVLIRVLGPDTSPERRARFLQAVRAASSVSHTHLAAIFTAGDVPDGAFSVSEWTGGVTVAHRIASGDTVEPSEFLPNAAGLAAALAALHAEGVVHGAIDPSAIHYAVAHPAKLAAFGRRPRGGTALQDVADLAATLETALTGRPPGGPPPSEVVDGLSLRVDRALRLAQAGQLTARALAHELSAAPTPLLPEPDPPSWSRRLLAAAAALVALAAGLIGVGRLLAAGSGAPILLPPAGPTSTLALPPTSTTSLPPLPAQPTPSIVPVAEIASFDPFGGGGENDDRLQALLDADLDTEWRTERYRDPLPRLKPGVGVVFRVEDTPKSVELAGLSDGVAYQLAWSQDAPPDPELWEVVASGRSAGGGVALQLPPRPPGYWLLWFTDLPRQGPDDHSARMAQVRFRA